MHGSVNAVSTSIRSANDPGTQCLLRAEIIAVIGVQREGYTIYAKEPLERSYESYSQFGGNDGTKTMYGHMMTMPDEVPAETEEV